ncbi:MAG: ribosome silencing factor [Mariprofundales bacterium]|nr:ribosome silencing factor [Mariprofundales bacterium]
MNTDPQQRLQALTDQLVTALEDKKAAEILTIDVQGRCSFSDRFVLANARNGRHLKALSQAVAGVGHQFDLPATVEGMTALEWLVVDLQDVIVHLFLPDIREQFQLERLWQQPTMSGNDPSE